MAVLEGCNSQDQPMVKSGVFQIWAFFTITGTVSCTVAGFIGSGVPGAFWGFFTGATIFPWFGALMGIAANEMTPKYGLKGWL